MSLRPLFVAIAVLAGPAVAAGATITVTTTAQHAAPGEGCTISDAILTATVGSPAGGCAIESGGDGLVIKIPAGSYVLTTGIANPDESVTAFPIITVPITIEGEVLPDGSRTVITRDANAPAFRLFRTQSSATFRGLTLSGGDAGTNCCGARHPGGAIYAWGNLTVTIEDVIFEDNTAGHGGAIADADALYSNVTFAITGSTFRNNHAEYVGGAIRVTGSGFLSIGNSDFENNSAGEGGAINSVGSTAIEGTQFVGNQANYNGGAVTAANVHLIRVTMRQNAAGNGGGAVHLDADWSHQTSGVATVVDSSFHNNQAQHGGALQIVGIGDIRGSTFVNNVATTGSGGAVEFGTETLPGLVSNSTFSGNAAADRGGAVYLYGGTLAINNVTITGNTSSNDGPGLALGWWGGSTVAIANSIVAGNVTTWGSEIDVLVNYREHLTSLGYNLIGSDLLTGGWFTGPGDLIGTEESPLNPGLEALADNGGPTQTRALAPGSPALDAGSPAVPGSEGACETTDQRGMHRPGAGTPACDIGAFEHVITFPLTVHVGAGGSVVGLNGSSACVHDDCVGEFDSGTTVKLEAQPASGHTFVGWLGGGCSASPVCFVTMGSAQTVTATFHAESAATTTTLTSSPNPSVNGQDVTLGVHVASSAAGTTPSGTVQFLDVTTGSTLGFATLDGAGGASIVVPLLAGTHEITAIYTGDGPFTASSDSKSQSVTKAFTTMSLHSSGTPSAVVAGAVSFTAEVGAASPGTGTPTGIVTFSSQLTFATLGTAVLNEAGVATMTTSFGSVGEYGIQASYGGDAGFLLSGASILQAIVPIPAAALIEFGETVLVFDKAEAIGPPFNPETTTIVTSSRSPSSLGEAITLTIKVEHTAKGPVIPTGSVIVVDGSTHTTLDTLALDATGLATLTTSALSLGGHAIVATYQGDATFSYSYGSVTQTVNAPAPTTTVVTLSPSSSVFGQPVTFTAVVSSVVPDTAPPGGVVTFVNATTGETLGTATLNTNRTATMLATSGTLPVQPSTIRATYAGDAHFLGSTGTALQTVARAATITTVQTSLTPSGPGVPVTIAAVVAAASPGAGSPTGLVSFVDVLTGTALGTVAVDGNRTAALPPTGFGSGTHLIRASYAGDTKFTASVGTFEQFVPPAGNQWPARDITVAETFLVSDQPGPMLQNTATGPSVHVQAIDPSGGNGSVVALTFAQVTQPGSTTAVAVTGPPPPTGFQLTAPPMVFEVATTAHYSGMITLCIVYPSGSTNPRLMHYEAGSWIDRTSSTNPATRTICAQVTSLSPFAVFVPTGVEGRIHGDGALGDNDEFDFRVAERSLGTERGALSFKHKTPKSGKKKARTDQFKATTIGSIVFWDDPTYRPSRRPKPVVDSVLFTGTGTWNGSPGYSFEAEAADQGEPGRGRDTLTIVVREQSGAIVFSIDGVLTEGNIQSQRVRNR